MKMKHILNFSSSLCFLLMFTLAHAQEETAVKSNLEQVPDSIPVKKDRYGLRLGVDLFKLSRGFYDKNYKGIELTGDFRWSKKYYLAAEIGNENKTTIDDRLTSNSKGTYLKVGFDYNMYENWLDMENLIYFGLRVGSSTFSQELNSYKIYNANPYWDEVPSITTGEKYNGLSASWIEVVTGVKAKVFNNVFVGMHDIPFFGTIRVGHIKEELSFYSASSGRNIPFMERPSVWDAIEDPYLFSNGITISNTYLEDHVYSWVGLFQKLLWAAR